MPNRRWTIVMLGLLVWAAPASLAEEVVEEAVEVGPLQRQAPQEEEKAQAADETQDSDSEDSSESKPTDEELRQQMAELERKLKEARAQFQQRAVAERQKVEQAGHLIVEQIQLPENATREQCEAYIGKLREAAQGKRSYSSNDPLVEKLKALPDEHFDLLMSEMANRTNLRYFANYAMRGIDPETLRERFVSGLGENAANIGVIVMNGWCEDVRDVILQHMESADGSLSPAWFQAAVELDEPKLYPKLHEVAISSRYAVQFITMLKSLPDYDIANTINVCWARASEGKLSVSQTSFAPMAAEFGNVDALGSLVAQLRSSTSYIVTSSTYNIRRTNALRFIDYRGSNSDIQNWYNANKDKLVFDHLRKRFVLPEDF